MHNAPVDGMWGAVALVAFMLGCGFLVVDEPMKPFTWLAEEWRKLRR